MLQFKAENNLITTYQTQIYHQETLVFELLLQSIESQDKEYDDDFLNEINSTMINWGKQELFNYCFISTYHLWEKQIGHIIRNQSDGKIPSPRYDFVNSVNKILKNSFNINCVNNTIWSSLDKARIIVNAFKHGEGNSLVKLREVCPEIIFKDESTTHHSLLEIQRKHLEELINSLKNFYECLSEETKLDFSNW